MRKMKSTKQSSRLFFAVFIFLMLGCAEESVMPNTGKASLLGEWKWIKTVAGWVPVEEAWVPAEETPATAGYTWTIRFGMNDTVEYYRNDSLTDAYPYELTYRKYDFLNPNSDSTLALIINSWTESFFSVDNDTLIIDQSYVDGPKDFYTRLPRSQPTF